ncbi:sensor histidine kinase [Megasphaera cerevisiae]|nr:HAMP domain-containing sensor histidine kinase [Megasphaera cerevisiae]
MISLSLRTKVCLYVAGFTLLCLMTLLVAIGLGFDSYFYEIKKNNMIQASHEISRIYQKEGMDGEEDIDEVSQNLGADVLIIDNSRLVYSSRPGRRVLIGPVKANENNIVVAVGKEKESVEEIEKLQPPKHIQEMLDLLKGEKPDESEIDKVQSYQPSKNFQYFNLIYRIREHTYLLISRPVAPMQESIDIVQYFIFTFGFVWLAAAVMGALLFANRLTKPLLELKRLSASMTQLDFSKKWHGTRKDEIGQLGSSLNMLSQQLNTALNALKESNGELQKQLNKAKEVEHMRKSFISAVSHELKTPLAIIQGYAEGLDSLDVDEDTRQRYCKIIHSETEKMDSLVKDLLNLSRLETGSFRLEMTTFDFGALADEAKERFANTLSHKQILMEWNLPEEMAVYGDPERVDMILTNLLSNAIDYTGAGRKIVIDAVSQEGIYTICIYNQGIQIPEEYQKRIWEPFYKVDTSRTRNLQRTFGGHGLGLGIVSALVKLHGQRYGMRNETDGVTFWFTLAAAPQVDTADRA